MKSHGSWRGELWDKRKNGEAYPKWLSVTAATNEGGEIQHFVVIFSDITPIKKTDDELYFLAHHDSLTGLFNRRQFQDLLSQALKSARRKSESLALLFIDLDSFKAVNDNFGHGQGINSCSRLPGESASVCARPISWPAWEAVDVKT